MTWVLRHCNHNGFPVVRGSPGDSEDDNSEPIDWNQEEGASSREGPLEGVILRSQLMVLLINKVCVPTGRPSASQAHWYKFTRPCITGLEMGQDRAHKGLLTLRSLCSVSYLCLCVPCSAGFRVSMPNLEQGC